MTNTHSQQWLNDWRERTHRHRILLVATDTLSSPLLWLYFFFCFFTVFLTWYFSLILFLVVLSLFLRPTVAKTISSSPELFAVFSSFCSFFVLFFTLYFNFALFFVCFHALSCCWHFDRNINQVEIFNYTLEHIHSISTLTPANTHAEHVKISKNKINFCRRRWNNERRFLLVRKRRRKKQNKSPIFCVEGKIKFFFLLWRPQVTLFQTSVASRRGFLCLSRFDFNQKKIAGTERCYLIATINLCDTLIRITIKRRKHKTVKVAETKTHENNSVCGQKIKITFYCRCLMEMQRTEFSPSSRLNRQNVNKRKSFLWWF